VPLASHSIIIGFSAVKVVQGNGVIVPHAIRLENLQLADGDTVHEPQQMLTLRVWQTVKQDIFKVRAMFH
jgi:hypothetical protein